MKFLKKIPTKIKQKYYNSPQRKTIENVVTNMTLDYFYKPYEKALHNASLGKRLSNQEKKTLKKLVKKLQAGKNYTERTRKAFDSELPLVIERICNGVATTNDLTDLVDLEDFLDWVKTEEKMKVCTERNLI